MVILPIGDFIARVSLFLGAGVKFSAPGPAPAISESRPMSVNQN
jgi:hypothetical protein